MNEMSLVAEVGGLFALCGISCMRNFTPTFVLLAAARVLPQHGGCPDFLNQLAASFPAVMLSDGALALFGAMAALEMAANWNMTLREYFADVGWEKYTKPFYAFALSMVVGAPESAAGLESVGVVPGAGSVQQAATAVTGLVCEVSQTLSNVVASVGQTVSDAQNAIGDVKDVTAQVKTVAEAGPSAWLSWLGSVVVSSLAAFGTGILVSFRRKIADLVRTIDPDNTLKLQTFASLVEETTWLALLVVVVLVPVLAVFLVLILALVGRACRKVLVSMEKKRSHACPQCGELTHDSAVKCPKCNAAQPVPYHHVGRFGLAAPETVDAADKDSVLTHHRALLMAHRCPICASPLKDKLVCGCCRTRVWDVGYSRSDLIRMLDRRIVMATVAGVLVSGIPVLGFLAIALTFNFAVLGVLRRYDSLSSRFLVNFVVRVVKWTVLIFAIIFSGIPFVGALFIIPYVVSYWMKRGKFLK